MRLTVRVQAAHGIGEISCRGAMGRIRNRDLTRRGTIGIFYTLLGPDRFAAWTGMSGARLRPGPRRSRTEGNRPRFPSVTPFILNDGTSLPQ